MKPFLAALLMLLSLYGAAQQKAFRFAFVSDTHIGSPNGSAEEDLRRTVADINAQPGIAFVVITGDITELGTEAEIRLAKQILDSLRVPWYIIPGNHDTGWSASGGLAFTAIFGMDKFRFEHQGVTFIGCASGPYVRMSDGHIPRSAVNWLHTELARLPADAPLVFLNHYPLDAGLDNWYEATTLLHRKNTLLALCGHGHANKATSMEDIPSWMGRSNLRAKDAEGGYNLVDFAADSIRITERRPHSRSEVRWAAVANQRRQYDTTRHYPRPDFSINTQYGARALWRYKAGANVNVRPAVIGGLAIIASQDGLIEAVDLKKGKRRWQFATAGPIFSAPATAGNKVVVGSSDGFVYCFTQKGKLIWKYAAGGPVLGAPLIDGNSVYIGASNGHFYALDLATGQQQWTFGGIAGSVVALPALTDSLVIFGAWDRHLYALNRYSGALRWKWNNGSQVINYAPAACTPVVSNGTVFIAAPDRYLTAIDLHSGVTRWRTNASKVRESIGVSEDGQLVYGKTMQDSIVAYRTSAAAPQLAWAANAGFGYEHTPSTLVEQAGLLYFSTRSGVVYALDTATRTTRWAFKIDNSMANTIRLLKDGRVLATTMDGQLCLLVPPKP